MDERQRESDRVARLAERLLALPLGKQLERLGFLTSDDMNPDKLLPPATLSEWHNLHVSAHDAFSILSRRPGDDAVRLTHSTA